MLFSSNLLKSFVIAFSLLFAGCAAHSPFIIKNTTDVSQKSEVKSQPHTNKVLFISTSLPVSVKFEFIGEINAGKIWYGSEEGILGQMADEARKLGADAVIEVKTWHQPSGFSWSAPHGNGKAVRILDKGSVDLTTLGGRWR